MNHLKMHSMNKIDENVSKIATLFPNCVTEAKNDNGEIVHKIDFDMLKQELSSVLVEGREERYQFTWPDKKQAILTANAPINKTLRPCREESVNFDSTENLYIEGDNLEVLKLLQETYLGKIKMIYIDPPYNTGNDFVYEDDFAQDAADYIANSGQTDEEGNRLVANTESNGRFHTDWLNMMYPRLKLARDLLSDDGVIFISIDDNEVENLKKICGEIFGESNFIADIIWKHTQQSKNDERFFSRHYNHTLSYAKNKSGLSKFSFKRTEEDNKNYSNPDNDSRGDWRSGDVRSPNYRKTLCFDIIAPNGNHIHAPENGWRWSEESIKEKIITGEIKFKDDYSGIIRKIYLCDQDGRTPENLWEGENFGTTRSAAAMIKSMFEGIQVFDTPKPIELVRKMMELLSSKDLGTNNNTDIILDFFSGSATTAHAVMQLNAEDGGKRKFIMVQLPEVTDEKSEAYKAGYKNICEIGKERIRRAGRKILETTIQTGGGTKDSAPSLDIGFRVLKCDTSNMEDVYYTPDHIDTNDLFKNNIKSDRTGEDLLFQTMLDLGIMLSSKIETKKINGKEVFCVEGNYLMACFDDSVDETTITEIAKEKPYYFVMRDPANSKDGDSLINNFEQIFTTYSPDTVRKVL